MASRLSEESLRSVYDAGTQSLLIQNDHAFALLAPSVVDLDKLVEAEDPELEVQSVPAQRLYDAIMQRGPEDCLEVLRLVSREQVVKIFDYDTWREDQLVPLKAIQWLSLFKELGPEQLYQRFRELDEEYQLALLGPLVEMFDEDEYEKLSHDAQDQLHRLPCGTQFYRIKSEDPRIVVFVEDLVEATLQNDIAYAYSLIAHAAYIPPNEQHAEIARFRRARIEEDGFVSYEESLETFRPLALDELRARYAAGGEARPDLVVAPRRGEGPFLLAAVQAATRTWSQDQIAALTHGFVFLANTLSAAAKVETDDAAGVRRILQHAQALAGLGLEHLSGGDTTLAVAILAAEHPKTLFRAGLTLVLRLTEATLAELETARVPGAAQARKLLALDRRGALLLLIEREMLEPLGFERVELLKGLCNRFPVFPAATVTESSSTAPRIVFKPLAALADLAELASRLDGLSGLLHLSRLAKEGDTTPVANLDRQLATALARVLIGGEFRDQPLTRKEKEALTALPAEAAQAISGDFLAGVEGTLRAGPSSWRVSAAVGIATASPVEAVVAEWADVMLRLAAARERSRGGDPGALGALVDLARANQEDH